MHDYVKNLAKVVRAAREEAHLSQAALAEQIGCDERTIRILNTTVGIPSSKYCARSSLIYTFLQTVFSTLTLLRTG